MRRQQSGWLIVLLGLLGLPVILFLGLWGYARWANSVPPFTPPPVVMPVPNGYERAMALCQQLPPEPLQQMPAWPNGPPDQMRRVVLPARKTLDQVRSTFKLQWRAPQWLGAHMPFPDLSATRACARYLVADGQVAESEGDWQAAIERDLDAMELGARLPRGGVLIHALVAVAIHSIGAAQAERHYARLPKSAIPDALSRLRRIRSSWPSWGEILEGERVFSLASMTHESRQQQGQTPLVTLRLLWNKAQEESEVTGESAWPRYLEPVRF